MHRKALDEKGRFDGKQVVPTRFVRACPRGHVDDLDWRAFVHRSSEPCKRQLWLDERGTGGDLGDLVVRCECGQSRGMHEAADLSLNALGPCSGKRPWLGLYAAETCGQPSRLLIRTATNSYFPQVVSVLSLPERASAVEEVVRGLWAQLEIVDSPEILSVVKKYPDVTEKLAPFTDAEVLDVIQAIKLGKADERPVKLVELDAILAVPEGYGDDVPIDPDFHARRLPDAVWRRSSRSDDIESVIQLHRLREVLALTGFTRFEAVTPDIDGEYDSDVQLAQLALEPQWFPAVENRGEGLFVQLRGDAVALWLDRTAVKERLDHLAAGHQKWLEHRKRQRPFPGGPYVLLHTLSHLLIQSLSMRCGYPASSIRERVYADFCWRPIRHPALHRQPGRRGHARWPGTRGAAYRAASRASAAIGSALFERPDLRPAHAGPEHGRALAPRGRLSRVHPSRGDLVRDAQRLPRPRSGGARARPVGRGLLRRGRMTDALLSLPANVRHRLVTALEAGLISPPWSEPALRSALGVQGELGEVAAALAELEAMGLTGKACAAFVRAAEQIEARHMKPDLVWSGPEVAGLHARDTRRVYEELLGSAEHSVWASSYAYFDGPRAFEVLAKRMDAVAGTQRHPLSEHPAQARGHERCRRAGASLRRPLLGYRLAGLRRGRGSSTTPVLSSPRAREACYTRRRSLRTMRPSL